MRPLSNDAEPYNRAMTTDKPYSKELLDIAKKAYAEGPGSAQEGYVLSEAAQLPGVRGNDEAEQRVLDAWHELFRQGKLVWGYNLNNPQAPFYHIPR